jgi:prepilin-type processing-associated H-X9-DG protein
MDVNLDSIDTSVLVNRNLSSLALYNSKPDIYKCPADITLNQGKIRARSVSMNCAVGTRWYTAGLGGGTKSYPGATPGDRVGGGWLSGSYHDPDPLYRSYGKISQITSPSPSDLWVIMDENPGSINDPLMAIAMTQEIVDFPASYHNGGAGISFADGHSEMRKWMDAFIQNVPTSGQNGGQGKVYPAPPNSQDLAWIQPRTSAPK